MTLQLQQVDSLDPPTTLVGIRCTLRALRSGDAPALQRHADDEAVRRNVGGISPHEHSNRRSDDE